MLKFFIKDLALGLVPIAQYPACLSLNNVMTGEHLVEDGNVSILKPINVIHIEPNFQLIGDLDNCHIFYQCEPFPTALSCGDMMFNIEKQVSELFHEYFL